MLPRVKEDENILKRRKANWIGHIMRRKCGVKRLTDGKREGRIEVTGRCKRDVNSFWMSSQKGEDTGN